jgi:SAM-dependent methyltransferase
VTDTPIRALRYCFSSWEAWKERGIDRRFNTDTGGRVLLDGLDFEHENKVYGNRCEPTTKGDFMRIMDCLPKDLSGYTFIDFGCGKGRAMLLAAERGFKKIIGLEFAPELAEIARSNAEKLRSKTGDERLEIVTVDASAFDIPEECSVLYFFNPFRSEVSSVVADNIRRSWVAKPRDMFLIWHNVCEGATPFYNLADFSPIAGHIGPDLPLLTREFVIFKSREIKTL